MTIQTNNPQITTEFSELGLPESIMSAVAALGYTTPTPIQAQAIPALLAGKDVLGQAQTGTGKTAAFALPLLANIQIKRREPQILVLVPTRELALQVAKAFSGFAVNLSGLNILAIYGGQGYNEQLSLLRKGCHIIIGTPGRVMDHIRRGTLNLSSLRTLVLDEADEMLKMGFAEDVEWILEQCPDKKQIGLFSATMPHAIKTIAERYLVDPERITVKSSTTTANTIRQLFWPVSSMNKLDGLSRILETEESDAILIFVRTKRATEEVAEQLVGRGFNAVAINGDIVQKQRERIIDQLKSGRVKIVVATDVAARGIDVDRITHVINYEPPHNTESYVHRIGRTGRAGRTGTAIIFISPRDKYLLRDIERATKQEIKEMEFPTVKAVNERRINAFKLRITEALDQDVAVYEKMLSEFEQETSTPAIKIAAVLAKLLQGKGELLLKKSDPSKVVKPYERAEVRRSASNDRDREPRADARRSSAGDFRDKYKEKFTESFPSRKRAGDSKEEFEERSPRSKRGSVESDMEQYRVDIGKDDGLQPKNLVGAIANTAGIEGRLIGKIKIESKFALIDLPKGMPKDILQTLKKLKISGKQMNLSRVVS